MRSLAGISLHLWCVICVSACAARWSDIRAASVPTAVPAPIHVTVTPTEQGAWRIEYKLSESARVLAFNRRRYQHRIADWRILEPAGAKIVRTKNGDAIVADQPFQTLTLQATNAEKPVEKDYELAFRFTDGSALLYTGHFDVHHGKCADAACGSLVEDDGSKWPNTIFRFVPNAGERVIVPDGTHATAAEWNTEGETTYIYFGKLQPDVGPRYTLVVDRGVPAWLRAEIQAFIPRTIDYYTTRLQTELPWKPRILSRFTSTTMRRKSG